MIMETNYTNQEMQDFINCGAITADKSVQNTMLKQLANNDRGLIFLINAKMKKAGI